MESTFKSIMKPPTVRFKLAPLIIVLAAVPFLLLLMKFDYRGPLAALLLLFFLILGLEYPRTGFLLLFAIIMLDFNPSTYHYHPDSIFTIFIHQDYYVTLHLFTTSGLIGGWVLRKLLYSSKEGGASPLHIPLTLLLIWMALAQMQFPFKEGNITGALAGYQFFYNFLLFFVLYKFLRSEKDMRSVYYVIICGLFLLFVYGMVKLLKGDYIQWGFRYFILSSEQAQMLHLLGLFALLAGLEKRIRFPLVLGAAIYAICLLQVFLSTSRANLVAVVFSFIVVMTLRFMKRKLFLLFIPVALIILGLGLNLYISQSKGSASRAAGYALERLETMSIQEADLSIVFRFLSYPAAFKTAMQNPLFGITFNKGYYVEMLGVQSYVRALDNSYLKIMLSAGIPALILYITCMIVIYKTGFRLSKRITSGMSRVMLISFLGTAVLHNILDFFQTNFAFARAMPLVVFAWAGIMKFNALYPAEPAEEAEGAEDSES